MPKKWLTSTTCALIVASTSACGGASQSFKSDGYYHEQYPLRVASVAGGTDALVGENWQLDNYQRDKKGRLLARKTGERYEVELQFDLDDDGEFDKEVWFPRFELLMTNRRNDGQIWISAVPLSGKNTEKELRVLLDRYVEAISGTGSVVVASVSGSQTAAVVDKRFATRVTEMGQIRLDGIEGLATTVEVANVDQLQLSPTSRWTKAKLVVVRPGFGYGLGGKRKGTVSHFWPVLLVAGYSNSTADFESGVADFERFLGKIDFLTDDEVLAKQSQAILQCVGTEAVTIDAEIGADGEFVKIPPNEKPCLRRILSELRFGAQGSIRHYRTTVTRTTPSSDSPKGYQWVSAIPLENVSPTTTTGSSAPNAAVPAPPTTSPPQ